MQTKLLKIFTDCAIYFEGWRLYCIVCCITLYPEHEM